MQELEKQLIIEKHYQQVLGEVSQIDNTIKSAIEQTLGDKSIIPPDQFDRIVKKFGVQVSFLLKKEEIIGYLKRYIDADRSSDREIAINSILSSLCREQEIHTDIEEGESRHSKKEKKAVIGFFIMGLFAALSVGLLKVTDPSTTIPREIVNEFITKWKVNELIAKWGAVPMRTSFFLMLIYIVRMERKDIQLDDLKKQREEIAMKIKILFDQVVSQHEATTLQTPPHTHQLYHEAPPER